MTRRLLAFRLLFSVFSLFPAYVEAQTTPQRAPLRVVSAGPTGEVRGGEGNEIRVAFSEPMVALARVPPRLRPAFFHITPAVIGTYRWSGTTILILTPAKRLPLATKYDVTIAAGTRAVSGRTLAAPYSFSFKTETAALIQTNWYRPGGRFDEAPIIVLRFNQPVRPEDVVAHVRATFEKHEFIPPVIGAAARARLLAMDPQAFQAFTDKVQRARQAAEATGPVSLAVAKDWDKKRFRVSPAPAASFPSGAMPGGAARLPPRDPEITRRPRAASKAGWRSPIPLPARSTASTRRCGASSRR